MTLASRIGVMHEGRIVQVGEPRDVYEHPVSRYVADFVGSVNLFEGSVSADEADFMRISAPELGGEIYVGHGVSCTMGQKVWYAIRPEKLRVSRERPEGVENAVRAVVDEVAYLGNLSIYQLRLETGKMLRATKANVLRYDEEAISWEEPVWVHWGA